MVSSFFKLDELRDKLAQVRSTQAMLRKRNETMKHMISQHQSTVQQQLQARKELLEKSRARNDQIQATLLELDAQANLLNQELELEYAELVEENLNSRRGSVSPRAHGGAEAKGQFPVSEVGHSSRPGTSEEWFAEDELEFSPERHDFTQQAVQCNRDFTTSHPPP